MASVYETMNYHKIDRRLYQTLISLGHLPGLARNIVVLWMWLELIGIDIIHYVKKITAPPLLLNFVKEAEAILNVIRQDSPPSDDDALVALPFTAAFATEPFNLRFFFYHKDVVMRGLTYLLDGVGTLIFNDQMYHMLNTYEMAVSHANQQRMRSPIMPAELAMQFKSYILPLSEDHRSLFITFSEGFAPKTEEIAEYFNEKTSQCVEKVMMEETAEGVIPMCGRVVFASEALIEILLNGEHMGKFVIKGREVWGRKYVRRLGRH